MWKLLLVCIGGLLVLNAQCEARQKKRSASGYAGSSAGGYYGGGGSAVGYGAGGTGGFGGGYDDYDYGYAPDFGFIDPLQFHQQLTAQIMANHAAQNRRIQQQIAQQEAQFNNLKRQHVYIANKYAQPNRYAPNYAAAGASLGPGGSHQTAYIQPENPAIPNISNRFGGPTSPGGFKAVAVSSFASSFDVNGQKTSHRAAQTTINDNGKITTYRVQS